MSRIGKKPIKIPQDVEVKIEDLVVTIKGPKGELKAKLHPRVKIIFEDKELRIEVKNSEEKRDRSLWGLWRTLIANMVEGVTKGYEKKLEINGVGYGISVSGSKLILKVGFSHLVDFILPAGIEGKVEKNVVTISGIDKQLVGETAARIRVVKKPEPYKGKGIKYLDEVIRRKAGKSAKAA